MFQENEVVMIILGLGTLIFILSNRHQFKRLPYSAIFLNSFYILTMGWLFTVLEGVFLEELLNYLEHISYAISSILLVIWSWKALHIEKDSL